jgi:hypothetical protein
LRKCAVEYSRLLYIFVFIQFRLDVIVIVVMGHFVHHVHPNDHVVFVTSVLKLCRKKNLRNYEEYISLSQSVDGENQDTSTVFTRLSAAAFFKFSEFQIRRSFGGGGGDAL